MVRYMIVEDDELIATMLSELITSIGGRVHYAKNAEEALSLTTLYRIDIALIDLMLPDIDGIELIGKLRSLQQDIFFIVITSVYEPSVIVRAIKEGASEYLTKPFEVQYLKKILTNYQELAILKKREKARLESIPPLEEILGTSKVMKDLKRTIADIARYDSTVLLTGPTGVGKGLIAGVIHRLSKRADGPFITFDCTTVPENLMEAELCGYKRGAFTGADHDKVGLVEMADGGTLFIDEIGELPLHLQTKLLRIIDEGSFRRLGDVTDRRVDVRVISATNKDLRSMVKEGRFRNDLYYRLDVISINVPPLSERGEDVWLLANYFLCYYINKTGKRIKGFSKEAERFIWQYSWPGNVRELKNLIERAVVMAEDEWIRPSDFMIPEYTIRSREFRFPETPLPLKEIEKRYIKYVLSLTGNNKSKAAKLLGITRNTLREKLKE
ncbi:MAG: sigma-54-dependent Fis family transcriptional regulator [Nitrospirae bacterium]|nr:sigma-54-dependent Fis family transcriptional regulator [Nitrospirota bacterium]